MLAWKAHTAEAPIGGIVLASREGAREWLPSTPMAGDRIVMLQSHQARNVLLVTVLLAGVCLLPRSARTRPSLTAEDLVRLHLESIGTPEARNRIKSRVLNGTAGVIFRSGDHGSQDGKATLISEGQKVRLGILFPNPDYPGEQLAHDGSRSSTGFLQGRTRSTLASVFYQYNYPLREGLLGGVASVAWPLLDVKRRRPMLDYEGLKEVDGRLLHQVKYRSRKGDQGFIVTLYFDEERFRHVRTKYQLKIGYLIGPDELTSARQEPTYCDLEEEFSDFRTVEGLTLPHGYKLSLNLTRKDLSLMNEWQVVYRQVVHNHELDEKYFAIK